MLKMAMLCKQLAAWFHPKMPDNKNSRRYKIIKAINIELLLSGIIIGFLNVYLEFWHIAYLLLIGTALVSVNLILIRNKFNLEFCAHIINVVVLVTISLGNFWLGGLSASYIGWFYMTPIISAITLGIQGLIAYSLLSGFILTLFIYGQFTPIYSISVPYLNLINCINYGLVFSLIGITLYSLLKENERYETLLSEQNFLLNADKKKFHYLSYHDPLTNLPNRSYFNHHLQTEIDSIDTSINILTLYFMDLDGFKQINDLYGHEVGDKLLLQAGKRLRGCFREHDFIARLGGDEFTAIIIHGQKDKISSRLMKRIEKEFTAPFAIMNLQIKCTISIGKSVYPKDATNPDTLLKIADDAMYKNKKKKYLLNAQDF